MYIHICSYCMWATDKRPSEANLRHYAYTAHIWWCAVRGARGAQEAIDISWIGAYPKQGQSYTMRCDAMR